MREPNPQDTGPIGKTVINRLTTGAFRLLSLAIQALVLGLGLLCLWQGKNMLQAAISQSPEVRSIRTELTALRGDNTTAKAVADTAVAKAEQSLAVQGKIFDALKQSHEDIETLKLSIAGSNATTAAEISALGKQLDRVEFKQDQGH